MSSIRIVEVPPGYAPEHIRKQWVGLTLPLATEEELAKYPELGIRVGTSNVGGHLVLRLKAVIALRAAKKYPAAMYWQNGLPATYLQFKRDVCELVD